MDKIGTWIAIAGVAIGFILPGWLLFSDNPSDKNKRTRGSRNSATF